VVSPPQGWNLRAVQYYHDEYCTTPAMAVLKRFFATTGQSSTRECVNFSEAVTLAARNARLNMIDHLLMNVPLRVSKRMSFVVWRLT
jgi:hypothetical protein